MRSLRDGTPFLHLLSLAKDVKLGKYTVPSGIRTPGRRVAVHYATAAPRKLLKESRVAKSLVTYKTAKQEPRDERASYTAKAKKNH